MPQQHSTCARSTWPSEPLLTHLKDISECHSKTGVDVRMHTECRVKPKLACLLLEQSVITDSWLEVANEHHQANIICIISPRSFKTNSEHHQHHSFFFLGGSGFAQKSSAHFFRIAGHLESVDDTDDVRCPFQKPKGYDADDACLRGRLVSESRWL